MLRQSKQQTRTTPVQPLAAGYRGIDFCDRCGTRLQSGEWLGGLCGACEKRRTTRFRRSASDAYRDKAAKAKHTQREAR